MLSSLAAMAAAMARETDSDRGVSGTTLLNLADPCAAFEMGALEEVARAAARAVVPDEDAAGETTAGATSTAEP